MECSRRAPSRTGLWLARHVPRSKVVAQIKGQHTVGGHEVCQVGNLNCPVRGRRARREIGDELLTNERLAQHLCVRLRGRGEEGL